MATRIPWCDETWNPMTGCTPVSEGCEHCYALRMLGRNLPNHSGLKPTFHADRLDKPLQWKKSRRIFVCSMGDLFHDMFMADAWTGSDSVRAAPGQNPIDRVLDVVRQCPQHDFLVLTKRPENMKAHLDWRYASESETDECPIPNLWLGVTAENQRRADERIPVLLDTSATVRFVSIEPMLGPVDIINDYRWARGVLKTGNKPPLDWIILGGETGPGARPMQPKWALDVWRECKAVGVSFFWKSWGVNDPWIDHNAEQMRADEVNWSDIIRMENTLEYPDETRG